MTAPSPSLNTGNAVSVSLKIDSATVDAEQLASIEVVSAANRISRGRIVVVLGWADDGTLAFSSVERFAPGQSVELGAGYDSAETVIHDGVITSLSLDISPSEPPRLVIESAGTEGAAAVIGPPASAPVLLLEYGVSIESLGLRIEAPLRSDPLQVRGWVRFQGNALAKPGVGVTLAGLDDRFNGEAVVAGATHEIAEGGWYTTVEIEMPG